MASLWKIIIKRALWLIGICVVLAVLFIPSYSKIQELNQKNKDLEGKTKKLRIENALLQQELKRLESDNLYQEKILRDKMGVVRKDEIPIKVVPGDTQKKE